MPLRAATMAWAKENLLNVAIAQLPPAATKIATLDADIIFRRPGWASQTLAALDLYPVVQPWDTAYDLGRMMSISACTRSFRRLSCRQTCRCPQDEFWASDGGPYAYPHPGYAWAWQRRTLDRIGGLFDLGGMGSGDHHMALGMVGHGASLPAGVP